MLEPGRYNVDGLVFDAALLNVEHFSPDEHPDMRGQPRGLEQSDARANGGVQSSEPPKVSQYRPCLASSMKEPLEGVANVLPRQVSPDLASKVSAIIMLSAVGPKEKFIEGHYRNPRSIEKRSSLYSSPVLLMLRDGAFASNVDPDLLNEKVVTSRTSGPNRTWSRSSDRNVRY